MRISDSEFVYKIRDSLKAPSAKPKNYGCVSVLIHKTNNYVIGYTFRCKDTVIAHGEAHLYCGKVSNDISPYKIAFRDKYIRIYLYDNNEVLICLDRRTDGKEKEKEEVQAPKGSP